MGETNSPLVAHVGYNISPLERVKLKILTTDGLWFNFFIWLSWVEKYSNPRATEGESIFIQPQKVCGHVMISLCSFSCDNLSSSNLILLNFEHNDPWHRINVGKFPAYYCIQQIIVSSNLLCQAKYCVHICFWYTLFNFLLRTRAVVSCFALHSPVLNF